jgi:hypothetical protein
MNCCNDYGQCTQGKDCPVRQACEIPEDDPIITLENFSRWVRNMFAGMGLTLVIASACFFYWWP